MPSSSSGVLMMSPAAAKIVPATSTIANAQMLCLAFITATFALLARRCVALRSLCPCVRRALRVAVFEYGKHQLFDE